MERRAGRIDGRQRPERLLQTVRALGGEVAGVRWFRDHHRFTPDDLAGIRRLAGGALPVTTEKDLVRIADPGGIVAIRVDVRILRGEDALDTALGEVL